MWRKNQHLSLLPSFSILCVFDFIQIYISFSYSIFYFDFFSIYKLNVINIARYFLFCLKSTQFLIDLIESFSIFFCRSFPSLHIHTSHIQNGMIFSYVYVYKKAHQMGKSTIFIDKNDGSKALALHSICVCLCVSEGKSFIFMFIFIDDRVHTLCGTESVCMCCVYSVE